VARSPVVLTAPTLDRFPSIGWRWLALWRPYRYARASALKCASFGVAVVVLIFKEVCGWWVTAGFPPNSATLCDLSIA